MKKAICLLLTAVMATAATGCSPKVKDAYTFDEQLHASFDGIGVEWDAYEHPNIITDAKWETVTARMQKLAPAFVRCMINLDWVLTDWQKGEDGAPDTWSYNWEQANIKSLLQILDYCQSAGVKVALGSWRAVDGWDMKDSADDRFAQIFGEIFDELVNTRGYTCIKWFVPTNEPNYLPGNTFETWHTGVEKVYAQFRDKGLLDKVSITGPDATSQTAAMTWCESAARDTRDKLGNYSIHLYVSDYTVDSGNLAENIRRIRETIERHDAAVADKGLYLWECGLIDGKNEEWDTNELIDTYGYGVRMADYTLQCIMGGAKGVCYWELDDAMHFLDNGKTKNWGMFSSLGDAAQQELRPWFSSSMLLSKMFGAGSSVYGCALNGENKTAVRAVAAVSADKTAGGYAIVNSGATAVTKTFYLPETVGGDKLYVYVFGEKDAKVDGDGYIVPNYELNGSLNQTLAVTVPAKSVVFVSNTKY